MSRLLIALILLVQGIPTQQSGTVTGVLRDSQGNPLAGVRIAAVARPDNAEQALEGTAMAGIGETDERGRFTLESVPPGRYYIAAGRLDLQTFFPGTQNMADATSITVSAGTTVADINFVLNNTSFGRASTGGSAVISSVALPVRVNVENGGRLPISSRGQFTYVKLYSNSASPLSLPLDGTVFTVPSTFAGDIRVDVENLPETYAIKSISYGTADITKSPFRLTPANFPPAVPTSVAVLQVLANSTASVAAAATAIVQAGTQFSLHTPTSAVPISTPAYTPPSQITITLKMTAPSPESGVHVTGRLGSTFKRIIVISGRPGTVYADGTFEFRGVPPGRHLIATLNNPSTPLAAIVVVGEQDVDGITLSETPLLPENMRTPRDPLPVGNYQPGSVIPLPRITGIVIEEKTREAIKEGNVVLNAGAFSRTLPIDQDGRFDPIFLLPGSYDVRLQIFGHSTTGPTITVEDKDLNLELTSRRLY